MRGKLEKKEKEKSEGDDDSESGVETTFFVDEAIPFENADQEMTRGVAICLKESSIVNGGSRTLYDILKTYRVGKDGNARGSDLEIRLLMRDGTRATLKCPEFKLDMTSEMRRRVEERFGDEAFQLIPAPQKQGVAEDPRAHWKRRKPADKPAK